MIHFKPISSYEETKKLFEGQAIPVNGQPFAVSACEGEERVGFCLFCIEGDRVYIKEIRLQNKQAYFIADGLCRSALNFAANRGVKTAQLLGGHLFETISNISALNELGQDIFDIGKFFQSIKKCGN